MKDSKMQRLIKVSFNIYIDDKFLFLITDN